MFVCGARELEVEVEVGSGMRKEDGDGDGDGNGSNGTGLFTVQILERHPFTTQTFIPLSSSSPPPSSSPTQYLVIVAPTLPPTNADTSLPAPKDTSNPKAQPTLPGRGMPDLRRIRAFLATGSQAVTYGAGTWHAPMAALGPPGSAVDFVVVQFANDEPVEDCQEVAIGGGREEEGGGSGIRVRVLGRKGEGSKL
ncbi:ureidoglycolate hydrolase [Daldinia grandis]|nr:ureidoglycolate hydrolase [Daldinia grandis]